MNDNAQQSTCPVRGLTLAGQALVNKLKEEHSLFIKETVEFFMANDIIILDDVLNLTEEALMNKILKQVHPYSVYYSESDMRWHTYLKDDTLYILQLLKEYYETENLVSEWLFVNKSGHIHNRAMDLRIRRYCRLAGINEKSLHKIRSIQKICILSNKKITETLYSSTFPHLLNNSERGIRSTLRYGPR